MKKVYRIIAWDLRDESLSWGELSALPEYIELPDGEDLNYLCMTQYGFEPAEAEEVTLTLDDLVKNLVLKATEDGGEVAAYKCAKEIDALVQYIKENY